MQWIINNQQSKWTTITMRICCGGGNREFVFPHFRIEFFRSNSFLIDFRIIGDFSAISMIVYWCFVYCSLALQWLAIQMAVIAGDDMSLDNRLICMKNLMSIVSVRRQSTKKSNFIEIRNLMSNTDMVSTEQKEVESIELRMLDQYLLPTINIVQQSFFSGAFDY